MILDLGCGRKPRSEADIGLDLSQDVDPDVVATLEPEDGIEHFPFKNGVANEVYMIHAIEHLSDLDFAIQELTRITKLGGRIHLLVPYYNSLNVPADPTHTNVANRMSEHMWSYYDNNPLAYETNASVKIQDIELVYRDVGLLQRLIPDFLKDELKHEIGNLVDEMRVEMEVVE